NTLLRADVRVFSASNKDLREEVRLGRFREDLLYRLNVITIVIPPLKERKEDIPILIENFIKRKLRTRVRKEISPEAMEMIMKYDWPGNIRELENVIEGAILLSKTDRIMPQDLPLPITLRTPPGQLDGAMGMIGTLISMKEIERLHIRSILQSTLWNKTKAAQILGISLKTLYGKLAHYNIKPD
ncbi:MAG: sigma-54-dependent Fis family transcriptional regulator, partial [Bacteroidetes bacterium]|nr:sigma-54-dependent Fis family transcriptional regulator [Bacteroidota bacterium]